MNTTLQLLTFNICLATFFRHPYARIKAFSRQSEVMSSDIINLQEVHTYDVLWRLRSALIGFEYVAYHPGLLGPAGGQVTFSKRPIRVIDHVSLGIGKGILILESSGTLIVNVHLVANRDGDWSRQNRFYPLHRQQLEQLNNILNQAEYRDRNTVLSGDFNLAKTSDLYPYFVKAGGWRDATAHVDSPTFHAEFLSPGKSLQRIDYIFTRGNIQLISTTDIFRDKVDGRYVSDHTGIMANLTIT